MQASKQASQQHPAGRRSAPRARADLAIVELDGQAVIYDELTGELHHLNESASTVFALCDGTETPREMASSVAMMFGVEREAVEGDVTALIKRFRKLGLLEG